MHKLEQILLTIPLFSGIPLSRIKINKLAGLTNQNYLININNLCYILRLPRPSTNENIDRHNEAYNQQIAQQLGLAPQVIWREVDNNSKLTGVSLSKYIADSQLITTISINDPPTLNLIAKSLKTLHSCQQSFKGILDGSVTIKFLQHYFSFCSNKQQQKLKHDYLRALQLLQNIDDSPLYTRPFVPSHIDLVLENILIKPNRKKQKIWLIDWEYSAMASPFWDLATLCNAGGFDEKKAKSLLRF